MPIHPEAVTVRERAAVRLFAHSLVTFATLNRISIPSLLGLLDMARAQIVRTFG